MTNTTWTRATPGTDYDGPGRLAAVDKIAKELDQFELSPVTLDRLRETLEVLDLLAAAAGDAVRASGGGPEFSSARSQRNWALTYRETLTDAYALVNHVANRKSVL